jgi:hypothetical protein
MSCCTGSVDTTIFTPGWLKASRLRRWLASGRLATRKTPSVAVGRVKFTSRARDTFSHMPVMMTSVRCSSSSGMAVDHQDSTNSSLTPMSSARRRAMSTL